MQTDFFHALIVVMVTTASLFGVEYLTREKPVKVQGIRNWFNFCSSSIDLQREACYTQILPGLYLSNARAATDRNLLRSLNISHVLTIETRKIPKSTFKDFNISTLYIRANDTPETNLLPYFPMANSFIEEGIRKGNVLVHCHFGVSRSATLVIAFIMEKFQLSYDQAFTFVRKKRKFINPNPGFVEQLRHYEEIEYDVKRIQRLEAFVAVKARKHKYKLAGGAAALTFGFLVPFVVMVV